jgi:hypothetical protein
MEKFNFLVHTGFSRPIFKFEDIISEEELNEVEREVDNLLLIKREVE